MHGKQNKKLENTISEFCKAVETIERYLLDRESITNYIRLLAARKR
jgi:hypothetical protein